MACDQITSISGPGVIHVAAGAFEGMKSLVSVDLPVAKYIGKCAQRLRWNQEHPPDPLSCRGGAVDQSVCVTLTDWHACACADRSRARSQP